MTLSDGIQCFHMTPGINKPVVQSKVLITCQRLIIRENNHLNTAL